MAHIYKQYIYICYKPLFTFLHSSSFKKNVYHLKRVCCMYIMCCMCVVLYIKHMKNINFSRGFPLKHAVITFISRVK